MNLDVGACASNTGVKLAPVRPLEMARQASDQTTTARNSGPPTGTLRVERTGSLSWDLAGAEANFPQSF